MQGEIHIEIGENLKEVLNKLDTSQQVILALKELVKLKNNGRTIGDFLSEL